MGTILNLVGFLNIIAHNTLINVKVPTNAQIFMSVLLPIISFDMINTTNLDVLLFEIDNKEAISERFRIFGYASKYMVPNLGSLFYFIVLSPVFFLTLAILNRLCKRLQLEILQPVRNFMGQL